MSYQIYDRFSHLNETDAGQEALAEYEDAIDAGKSADEAEVIASNVLQRAGYNVNAHGGVSIRVKYDDTYTEAGKAALNDTVLTRLESPKWGTAGSIVLGKLSCGTYCLFWQWGGDWMVFGDGQEHDREQLDGWEPDAIREAVAAAKKLDTECAEDMDWFLAWADAAEKTLSESDD